MHPYTAPHFLSTRCQIKPIPKSHRGLAARTAEPLLHTYKHRCMHAATNDHLLLRAGRLDSGPRSGDKAVLCAIVSNAYATILMPILPLSMPVMSQRVTRAAPALCLQIPAFSKAHLSPSSSCSRFLLSVPFPIKPSIPSVPATCHCNCRSMDHARKKGMECA